MLYGRGATADMKNGIACFAAANWTMSRPKAPPSRGSIGLLVTGDEGSANQRHLQGAQAG